MAKVKKAVLYAYVGNDRGVAVDFEGTEHRNEWVKLNLELNMDEVIEKLTWKTEGAPDGGVSGVEWGTGNIVVRKGDLDRLTGKLLTYCDAMMIDKSQKDAWKNLVRTTIHEWHDDKYNRFILDDYISDNKVN